MTQRSSFRYFETSPEVIRLAVKLYVRFPLSLRNVEHLLHERGIEVSHETVRFWWQRFGPMFAAEIRQRQVNGSCQGQLARPSDRDLSQADFIKASGYANRTERPET